MRKKQTAVTHSSAESDIIALAPGLRIDGSSALQFGECVLETLSSKPAKGNLECHKRERVIQFLSQFDNCVFGSLDDVPANISNSAHPTQLYMFKDNVAVIQMINKGRSPNLKHVTRTHRAQLDWLFGRSDLDLSFFD